MRASTSPRIDRGKPRTAMLGEVIASSSSQRQTASGAPTWCAPGTVVRRTTVAVDLRGVLSSACRPEKSKGSRERTTPKFEAITFAMPDHPWRVGQNELRKLAPSVQLPLATFAPVDACCQ